MSTSAIIALFALAVATSVLPIGLLLIIQLREHRHADKRHIGPLGNRIPDIHL